MKRTLLALSLCLSTAAFAQVPTRLGYQGRLFNSDGTAATGTVTLAFSLFADATGGTAVWGPESHQLVLSDGWYALYLGDRTPSGCMGTACTGIPETVFTGADLYLELSVNGTSLTPRQRVASVAYAVTARNLAGGSVSATSISVGGSQVINNQGRLVGAAAYSAGPGIEISMAGTIGLRSGCAAGQVLRFDGSSWVCATLVVDGGVAANVSVGAGLAGDGSPTDPLRSTLTAGAGLTLSSGNVLSLLTTCSPGQSLVYSGTSWVCSTLSASDAGGFTGLTVGPGLLGNGTPANPLRLADSAGVPSATHIYANGPRPLQPFAMAQASATFPRGSNAWDAFGVRSPAVVRVGSTYRMVFVGETSTTVTDLGTATSTDGVVWTRTMTPVLTRGATGQFDAARMDTPCMLHDGTTYHLYYAGLNAASGGAWRLGKATSTDGQTWTKVAGAAGLGSVLSLGAANTFDDAHVWSCSVMKEGTAWTLWYAGYDGTNWRIGRATSTDGSSWTKDSANPVLNTPVASHYDFNPAVAPASRIWSPSVARIGSTYYMLYAGSPVPTTGAYTLVGLATSRDGRTWSKSPVPAILNEPGITGIQPGSWVVDGARILFFGTQYNGTFSVINTWVMDHH